VFASTFAGGESSFKTIGLRKLPGVTSLFKATLTCSVEDMACSCSNKLGLLARLLSGVLSVEGEVRVRSLSSLLVFDSIVLLVDVDGFRKTESWTIADSAVFSTVALAATFLRLVGFGGILDIDAAFAPLRRVATMMGRLLLVHVSG
jgi:hypothetical protein